MRHPKGYVRFWCTHEWLIDCGAILKNALILKCDPLRECYLVEARKFRWPK